MKKKTSIIIGIIIAVAIIMIGGGVAVSGVLDPYEKQIKLGYKMISEEKYGEAILAFNTAIEIDQKKEKAYIGLADTYVARCDENTVNDANGVLSRGYEQSQSDKIVQGYIDNAQVLYNKDKKDWAIQLLDKGYEITKNDKIKAKREELIKMISSELLDKLFKYCEDDNLNEVRKIMNTEEFTKIAAFATPDEPLLYSPDRTKSNKSDKGIGIYYIDSIRYGKYFIYFGDYSEKIRNGNGLWIGVNGNENYTFNGMWSDDKPNGQGEVQEWYSGLAQGITIRQKIGELSNGLWNGNMQWNFIYPDKKKSYQVSFEKGIVAVLEKSESKDNGLKYRVTEITEDTNGDSDEMDFKEDMITKHHGVVGFEDNI